MKPTVDAVASEHPEKFIVARLDIDDNPKTLKEYGVRSIPTYIVFRDGEVVGQFVGAPPKAAFVQQILDILK
ncbi:MAG: thioredoxin domain-containing protein [Candidatus Poribacteria bacterium]|nr:thioredoxin domain-containing protein [Candidatus Poribacteria bacterium]